MIVPTLRVGTQPSTLQRPPLAIACYALTQSVTGLLPRRSVGAIMQQAQAWLDDANSICLWANLLLERQLFSPGAQRHAFELGFLSRIHQRLCSPLGGGHLALQIELRL